MSWAPEVIADSSGNWCGNGCYHPGHPDGEYRTAWRGEHFFAELDKYDDVPQLDMRSSHDPARP